MWGYSLNYYESIITAAVVLLNVVLLKRLFVKFSGKGGQRLWLAVALAGVEGACYLIPYFGAERVFAVQEILAGALLFLLCFVLIGRTRIPEEAAEEPEGRREAFLAVIPAAGILALVCLFLGNLKPYYLSSLCCACILAVHLSVFYLYNILIQNFTHLRQRDIYRQQTDHYRNQLEVITESQGRMRALRHDMRNHILHLMAQLRQGNGEEALTYLKSMEEELLNPGEHAKTGSREIDSLLNYKLERAGQVLEEVECSIHVPAEFASNSFDINVILGNLLDNAIEAAQDSERKWLKLVMRADRGVLLIHVANSFGEEPRRRGSRFLSTKKDSGEHGIGLHNVRRMVERLHGEIDFRQEGEVFSVDVMLYMNNSSAMQK